MDNTTNTTTDTNITVDNIDPQNLLIFKEYLVSSTPFDLEQLFKDVHKSSVVNPTNATFSYYKSD